MAGNLHRRAVEREDPVLAVGRGQAAEQVIDHVLVEELQVGDFLGRLDEPDVGAPDPFGQRSREERDAEQAEHVQADRVLHHTRATGARRR